MDLYKLTDSRGYTRGNTKWGPGVNHTINKKIKGNDLCSSQVIHAYDSIVKAFVYNQRHAGFENFIVFSAFGIPVAYDGYKVGVKSLTVIEDVTVHAIEGMTRFVVSWRRGGCIADLDRGGMIDIIYSIITHRLTTKNQRLRIFRILSRKDLREVIEWFNFSGETEESEITYKELKDFYKNKYGRKMK